MPDNYQDWTADEAFWNEAWTDMEQRLDEAAPARRRKAILWWWIGPALLLAGGAVWLLLAYGQAELNAFPLPSNANYADELVARQTSPQQLDETESSPAAMGDVPVENGQVVNPAIVFEAPVINTVVATVDQVSSSENQAGLLSEEHQVVVPVDELSTEVDNGNVAASLTIEQRVEAGVAKAALAEVLPLAFITYNAIYHSALELNQPSIRPSVLAHGELDDRILPRQSSKYSLLLESGLSQGSISPGFGYFGGLQLNRHLGNNGGRITASLGFYGQKENLRFSSDGVDFDDAFQDEAEFPQVVNGQDTVVVSSVAELNQPLSDQGVDFVTTYSLRLGLGYEHQLSKRWSLSGELGLNYLLGGRGPQLLQSVGAALGEEDSRGLISGNGLYNFSFDLVNQDDLFALSSNQSANNGTIVRVNRLRLDMQLGAAYHINNRWAVAGGVRGMLTPLFKTDVLNTDFLRGELGVRMRIGH